MIVVVGIVCHFTGYIRAHDSGTYGIPPIMGAGIGLIIFKVIFVIVRLIIIIPRRRARMREAIAEESMKYSSRSPIPCS